jgi:hypothetical protein
MKERRDDLQLSRRDANSATVPRFSPEGRADGLQEDGMPPLPPRRVKYPSNKYQTARFFYNSLIVLFLALMAALFMLGHWIYENGG